jgi:hypothetical protein
MNLGPQRISDTYQFVLNASGGSVTLGNGNNPNWIGTTVASTTGTQTISGVKTFDNNTVFNGSIGVGTSSPTCPLDIASAGIRINTSRYISSDSNSAAIALFGGTAGNGANIELYGSSHVGSPNAAYFDADSMYFRNADASSERMRITSAGNVGIGTSNPTVKLEVQNGINEAQIRLGPASASGYIYGNATNQGFYSNAGAQIDVGRSSNSIRMVGNVGVGTTPTARLDVVGPTLTLGTPSTYAVWISNGGGGSNGDLAFASNSTNAYIQSWASKPLIINNQGNNVGIRNATPTTALDVSGTTTTNTLILGTQANKATISYGQNTARTFTLPSVTANSTFAFIDQAQTFSSAQTLSSDLRVQGNLDFGSSTLVGTAHSSLFKINGGTLGNTLGNTINLASIGFSATEGTSLSFIARRQSAGPGAGSSAIGLSYNTGNITGINSQQIWMEANGRVGIGTNAPTEKLDINGNLKVNGSIQATSGVILSYSSVKLQADVPMSSSNNVFVNVTGLSLTSGTWLVNSSLLHSRVAATAETIYARISGSSTIYASTMGTRPATASYGLNLSMTTIIPLTTSTTITLQAATSVGATTSLIKRELMANPQGNNATQITAIRVA